MVKVWFLVGGEFDGGEVGQVDKSELLKGRRCQLINEGHHSERVSKRASGGKLGA